MTTTMTRPRARTSDPTTSHEAAASVGNITDTQFYVLKALVHPAHDVELLERYRNFKKAPMASDSGIRSRRAELVDMGAVQDSGHRFTLPSGRSATVWELNLDNYLVKVVTGK